MDIYNDFKSEKKLNQKPSVPVQEKKKEIVHIPAEMKQESGFSKFIKSFVMQDIGTIKNAIIYDHIVPGIKNAILGGIDMLFYKGDGNFRGPYRGDAPYGSHVNYGNYSKGKTRVQEQQQINYDYRNLSWDNRGKAEAALTQMWDILNTYKIVGVADLFDIAQMTVPGDSTGNNFGWRDLSGSRVVRRMDGRYSLELPMAVSIK